MSEMMHLRKVLFLVFAGVGLITTSNEVSAAGLEVTARAAYGSAGAGSPVAFEPSGTARIGTTDAIWGGSESPYGGGPILQGGLGVRTGKWVSVGVEGGVRYASASSIDFVSNISRSAWFVGPYVRAYLPMVPVVDPWIGLGARYVADTQTYNAPVPTTAGDIVGDYRLEHHGVAVPITVGVDYTIAKMFSIGPSFEYAIVFPAGGCAKLSGPNLATASFCASDDEAKRLTAAKGYGVWSVGLNLRLTVPPVL